MHKNHCSIVVIHADVKRVFLIYVTEINVVISEDSTGMNTPIILGQNLHQF